jgi:hypothetical protein
MKLYKKSSIGKALTLLLSIALISLELITFHSLMLLSIDPIKTTIKEIPTKIDNTNFLINLLNTKYDNKEILHYLNLYYYSTESKSEADFFGNQPEIIKHLNKFVENFYGNNYVWFLEIENKETLSNDYYFIKINKKTVHDSSIKIPLHSKEVINVKFKVYKK